MSAKRLGISSRSAASLRSRNFFQCTDHDLQRGTAGRDVFLEFLRQRFSLFFDKPFDQHVMVLRRRPAVGIAYLDE